MDFSQPLSEEEETARRVRGEEMRAYIRSCLDAGQACPTSQQVVDAVGRPPGLAIDVLCEFPEYAEVTRGGRVD